MKSNLKLTVIVAVVFVIGLLLGVASSQIGTITTTSVSTTVSTLTSTSVSTTTETQTLQPTTITTTVPTTSVITTSSVPTVLPTSVVIGEFNVTVKEATWGKALNNYNSSYKNGSFLLVSLSVENIGVSQRLFGVIGEYFGATGTAEIAVIDSKGIEYSSVCSFHSYTCLPQMVGPKISNEWTIAFDVPLEAQDLRIGLRTSKMDAWTLLVKIERTTETTTTTTSGTTMRIGDTAIYEGLELTITSSKVSDRYTYYSDIWEKNMTETASAGKKFVLILAEARNTGSNSEYVGAADFSLSDSNGYRYDATCYLGIGCFPLMQDLYQNDRIKGFILFEIPKDAIGLKLRYDFGTIYNPHIVTWDLGE